jgi:hypothetical protein
MTTVGADIVRHILVIHALSRCDTTSAAFGHGKTEVMMNLSDSELECFLAVMSSPIATATEVGDALASYLLLDAGTCWY